MVNTTARYQKVFRAHVGMLLSRQDPTHYQDTVLFMRFPCLLQLLPNTWDTWRILIRRTARLDSTEGKKDMWKVVTSTV